MKKKIIALCLIFAMLVPLTPAVAADNTVPKPTVDEILNEYHQKAFEIDIANASASQNSVRSVQTKDALIQETVNTLNAAGYAAYHVTSDNYSTLETQMRTDFTDMGLDPNGSYIIVISGEDTDNVSARSSRDLILPAPDPGDDEDQTFIYTYEGIRYTMRYVTILPVDGVGYIKNRSVDIDEDTTDNILSNLADALIFAFLDDVTEVPVLGDFLSILGISPTHQYIVEDNLLRFHAEAKWTRKFVQVKIDGTNQWFSGSMVEYVDLACFVTGALYDSTTGSLFSVPENRLTARYYSTFYNDTARQKQDAVRGYLMGITLIDETGSVDFSYNGDVLITLRETFSYVEIP